MSKQMEYFNAKSNVLRYLEDRSKFIAVYEDIKNNIYAFKKVTKPYEFIPKTLVDEFIDHLDKVIEENADVFNTNNRS